MKGAAVLFRRAHSSENCSNITGFQNSAQTSRFPVQRIRVLGLQRTA